CGSGEGRPGPSYPRLVRRRLLLSSAGERSRRGGCRGGIGRRSDAGWGGGPSRAGATGAVQRRVVVFARERVAAADPGGHRGRARRVRRALWTRDVAAAAALRHGGRAAAGGRGTELRERDGTV